MTNSKKQAELHLAASRECYHIDVLNAEILRPENKDFIPQLIRSKSEATRRYSDILEQITEPLKLVP